MLYARIIIECSDMRVNAKVLIKAGMNLAEMNGLICCLHPDEMGFYIIAGVVDGREKLLLRKCLITSKGYLEPRL